MTEPTPIDPSPFRPNSVAPDVIEANARLAELTADATPTHEQEPAAVRAAREAGQGWAGPPVRLEQAEQRTIAGSAGDLPVRVFVPEQVDGVYLHMHGGGWVLGRADQQDERLWATACAANVAVVSVDYRLAPEHPSPAAQNDCEAAALWLAKHVQTEFGTERLAIGGESAGGHLAVLTLLRMRDRHDFAGFLGANLAYSVFDLTMTPSSRAGTNAMLIPTATMSWFIDHFVPTGDRDDPAVSPIYADLQGLPPALFTVGTFDPLLDDSLLMYQRWLAAGNDAELAVYPGGIHGFTLLPTAIARSATQRQTSFLRTTLQGGDSPSR